jgi:hypothetical protein
MPHLFLASLLALAAAEDKPATPKGPAPVIRLAKLTGRHLILRAEVAVPKVRAEQREVEAVVDGKRVKRVVTVQVVTFVNEVREQRADVKDVKAEEVDGGKVDRKTLARRLTKFTPVVVSGAPLDPGYRRLFRKGTLVLVVPAAALAERDSAPEVDAPARPRKRNDRPPRARE